MAVFNRKLVRMGAAVATAEEVIRLLAGDMVAQGLVDAGYCEAVLEREKVYPTGLPVGEIEVAIPHAGGNHVLRAGIAITQLQSPVRFYSMGDHEQVVEAQLVFLLAILDPKEQLQTLRTLITTFQDTQTVHRLVEAQNLDQFVAALGDMGWEEES